MEFYLTASARACSSIGSPWTPPENILQMQCRILCGLQVELYFTVALHRLQGDSLPHHALGWAASTSSSLTLVYAELSLSFPLPAVRVLCVPPSPSHTHARVSAVETFLSFLILTEVPPASVMGSTLASDGCVGPGGTICVHRGAAPSFLSQSLHLLPTPCRGDLMCLPRQV